MSKSLTYAARLAQVSCFLFAVFVLSVAVPVAAQATGGGTVAEVGSSGGNLPLVALGSALTAMTGLVATMLRLLIRGELLPRNVADHQEKYLAIATDSQHVAAQLVEIVVKAEAREQELWQFIRDGRAPKP